MNSFCFFMLLHTTETPNETFLCFCTRQKRQMKLFCASAHDRNTKWNFFMLLHTTERLKRSFSCCCTLQKDQKEEFHASAHCRKTKKKISALGESHFPKGLAFPRSAKVISRKVWHFRAWRKSFPERFGVSALSQMASFAVDRKNLLSRFVITSLEKLLWNKVLICHSCVRLMLFYIETFFSSLLFYYLCKR